MFYFISEDLIREKQTILYCLTTTVRAAAGKEGMVHNIEEAAD